MPDETAGAIVERRLAHEMEEHATGFPAALQPLLRTDDMVCMAYSIMRRDGKRWDLAASTALIVAMAARDAERMKLMIRWANTHPIIGMGVP